MPPSHAAATVASACDSGITSHRSPSVPPPIPRAVTQTSVLPIERNSRGFMLVPHCHGARRPEALAIPRVALPEELSVDGCPFLGGARDWRERPKVVGYPSALVRVREYS